MTTENILWIIAITIIALLVAIFQYFFKAKRTSKKTILFAFLRFLSIFIILLLLVNPKITITNSKEEKPELKLLVDQSQSILHLKQEIQLKQVLSTIQGNKKLQDKFDISVYGFGEQLMDSVSVGFKSTQTKIEQSLVSLQKIHRKPSGPILLLTDGNQTYGKDYSYFKSKYKQPIYSIPLGDTTRVADLSITTINANKYVYLNNEFPMEVLVNYTGQGERTSNLNIHRGKQKVYSEKIRFTTDKRSHFVTPKIKATVAGLQNYSVRITPFKGEENNANNNKNILVETIDEKTSVLLVSNITHPDIGALKRNVESNKRRRLKIVKPINITSLDGIELVILYQPDSSFKSIYDLCDKAQIPLFTITGKKTDWNFINSLKRNYQKPSKSQVENILPVLNTNFEIYNTDQFGLEKYPPLENTFGEVQLVGQYETLLFKKVANVTTQQPLLVFWNNSQKNEAVLFGEGLWKWRLANYKRDENFDKFDDFFGKIIQYLSNKKVRKRLIVNHENVYYTNSSVLISASYFNQNYEFDTHAKLLLSLKNEDTQQTQKIALELKGSFYEIAMDKLEAGSYKFDVSVKGTKLKTYGGFEVQDFDIEKQFQNPNTIALGQIATANNGKLVYPNQVTSFVDQLIKSPNYKSTLKYTKEQKSLIDWKFILGILIALLGLEWFLRKYSGLI